MPGEAKHRAGNNSCFRFVPADDAGGPAEGSLEAILAEQRRDWITGKRFPAGERLRQYPALAADPVQGAELVYHEFALRQELGESPDWQDYLRQFPRYATGCCCWARPTGWWSKRCPQLKKRNRASPSSMATSCSKKSATAAWASCSRPGRKASTGWWP